MEDSTSRQMSATIPAVVSGRRQAVLVLLGAVLFLGAGLVEHHTRGGEAIPQPPPVHYGITVTGPRSAALAAKARAAAITKAARIRGEWRVWALQHRTSLLALADDRPGDSKALDQVWAALPTRHRMSDWPFMNTLGLHAGQPEFTWQPAGRENARVVNNDPGILQAQTKARGWLATRLQENFEGYRDIELSVSMTPGLSRLTLWASGRVTETDTIRQHIPGRPVVIDGSPKEVLPQYSFLRHQKGIGS